MSTRTQRRMGTKSKNFRHLPTNIHHRRKVKVGRRSPYDIRMMVYNMLTHNR